MTSGQSVTLLLVLALVLVAAKTLGSLLARLGQPAVIGEILAGILLGPTLLPDAVQRTLFPADIHLVLSALGSLGVALFLFLIGQELALHPPRRQTKVVLAATAGSIAVPFGLACLLAVTVVEPSAGGSLGYTLFLGTAMSVTAFPVLARIVRDRDLLGTPVAGIALASAAIGDLLAWSMLAVTVMVASGHSQWRLPLMIPLLALMFAAVRPLLARWADRRARLGRTREPYEVALAGLLACGAATEWLGLHFIFGAFLFGLVMPSGPGGLREPAGRQLGLVTEYLLLPVYFVVAGAKVDLSRLGTSGLAEFSAIMLVAVGGKYLGAAGAARWSGLDWRRCLVLATLVNTRGLTELIILTAGLQLGLLDQRLYSLMVLMAVLTTVMAGPVLRALYPPRLAARDRARAAAGEPLPERSPVTTGPAAVAEPHQ
ncbi:cation:proton antiporter [Streptomyces sp. 351MFTsu5.1]|uniref:cation:proton antiporter domain-containing protein n=1 Tax=Streptomyces sp. 351MFTsu5.1 TaxID=1172180 RepID=UPI00036C4EA1|nr:cation:proton antiporter [Streptomyces sp. 351MFTsu5.1]